MKTIFAWICYIVGYLFLSLAAGALGTGLYGICSGEVGLFFYVLKPLITFSFIGLVFLLCSYFSDKTIIE